MACHMLSFLADAGLTKNTGIIEDATTLLHTNVESSLVARGWEREADRLYSIGDNPTLYGDGQRVKLGPDTTELITFATSGELAFVEEIVLDSYGQVITNIVTRLPH